jgi:hypothetical protein
MEMMSSDWSQLMTTTPISRLAGGSLTRHFARAPVGAKPDAQTIADAYVYLLGRALVIRQEHLDLDGTGADYNLIDDKPLGAPDGVNPNFDVASVEAWLAVDDRTPVMLEVPEIVNRHYNVQVIDEWGGVIANINPRTFPSHPSGRFAFVKPGSRAKVPANAARIVLRSSKAKVVARVEIRQDREASVRLQRQFELASAGSPSIVPAVPLPMFGKRELIGVELFQSAEEILATALDTAPGAAALQHKVRLVAGYTESGPEARLDVEGLLRERLIPHFLDFTAKRAMANRHQWRSSHPAGSGAVADYQRRTAANLASVWTDTPDEALTFQTTRDAAGKPLNGSNTYVMEFAADELPAALVSGHWSLTLVSMPGYRVVPNPLNRFLFNSHSRLICERDGSLRIFVGPRPPRDVPESNWLPSSDWKPFLLTMRTYVPKAAVASGEWFPPVLATLI